MDDSQSGQPQAIYTQIGMIMEDAAPTALRLGGSKATLDPVKVRELEQAVAEINEMMMVARMTP
ncbi:MAG: hypothetical protein AAF553_00325 [Pseudomonadota bacterium]